MIKFKMSSTVLYNKVSIYLVKMKLKKRKI